ncbi:MAG: hypothetical protein K2X81_10850, partial [Candidatus Obscuribacterales bacterium]|nr:hypothetical protein [Candidatus Obscuribacterales bacterium]
MTIKRWITFISLSVLTSLSLLGLPQESQAQQDKFFTNKRVEVLRTNEGTIDNRIDPATLEQAINEQAKSTGIQPYVVIAAKDNLSLSEIKQLCKQLKQQVLAQQDTVSSFPRQNFLLLVYATSTYQVYDPKQRTYIKTSPGWLDAEAGEMLREKYRLTESRFAADDGPVQKAIKRYMPQRPQAFIQEVVKNVCDEVIVQDALTNQALHEVALKQEREAQRAKEVAAENARREQEQALETERLAKEKAAQETQARSERQKQAEQPADDRGGAANVLPLLLVLAGLTAFGFVVTFFLRKNKATSKISEWEKIVQNLDGWYLELHNEYGTTMNRKPTGQTKKDLERALTKVAEFTLRRNAAPERLNEAKTAFGKNSFPFSSGFARAIDLLTSVPILVDVRKIPIEEADPLKGFYRDLKETPSDLQHNARSFFQEAVAIFSTLEKAVEIISEM